MARIRVSCVIDAPTEVVWADVEDLAGHADWMEDAVAIRFLTDRRSGIGARFECDTRIGPFRLTDVMEIIEWTPGEAMGVHHSGLVTGDGRFTLEPLPGGRTRFQWRETLRFPIWMGGPIGAAMAKPVLSWVWRRNLRNLARRHV